MASRSLDDLKDPVRRKAMLFKNECLKEGIDVLIYCTLRSVKEQNELYARGRTVSGSIVTNARGGESFHNWGAAFDCVPLINGKAAWDDKATYAKMGLIGEAVGLEWAGRWKGSLRETAHFQYTGGLTLVDLKAGKIIM
jgi:peptidoglycan L-alanyl-D-glutamate endopeptidase CwlK